MFENIYIQQRIEKANALRDLGINPYANESFRNTTISKYLNVNNDLFKQKRKGMRKDTIQLQVELNFLDLWEKQLFLK